jgi:hypothetical protein
MANTLSNQETAPAEAALKRAHYRLDRLEAEVFGARTRARELRPAADGWASIIDRHFAIWRAEYARARAQGAIAAAACALKWKEKFDELARTPWGERSSLGFQASQQAALAHAPLPPIFDAANFCARLATQGISLTVGPNGEILARGRLDPTARQIITRHKVEIVGYLQTPAQVVA